jgi:error-prone DNA polymerase
LKVDCLALGMLSAIHRAFDLINRYRGSALGMESVPAEDPAVYRMIQRADTVGVFQIESRAQMAMLPRLRPACFYDLVIEVAIVRPGPIQGDMVHPYLSRRQGQEAVSYPSEEVRAVLERTMGVPIFQEQVIKLAMVAAGFSAGEADHLRRSMAAWRRNGTLHQFKQRLIDGMCARGYTAAFAQRIYDQIQGFGEYGFPESHSASFALLVYVSAWIKYYEPAAFLCALLNSQPMGFYVPAQLVRDARQHGVEVRSVDVCFSDWDSTLEKTGNGQPAVRLGLRQVWGLSRAGAEQMLQARAQATFMDVNDLASRAGLKRKDLETLASAGALQGLSGHRYRARWVVAGVETPLPLFEKDTNAFEAEPLLRRPSEGEDILADYASLGLSLRAHPLSLLRPHLDARRYCSAKVVHALATGEPVRTAGLVVCRQHPSSASGVVFITLEDETGHINLILWPSLVQRQRREVLQARLLAVEGEVQNESDVVHVVARRLIDETPLLGGLVAPSRDFR